MGFAGVSHKATEPDISQNPEQLEQADFHCLGFY